MRTAQQGDRVRVHYVKRSQHGCVSSSRGRPPLEMTVGIDHGRLPGLGLALVGRCEGERVRMIVPAEQAYGPTNPERVRRLPRSRFPRGKALATGSWVRVMDRKGRRRLVRVVELLDDKVVVDINHPWAGQAVALEVVIVSILASGEVKLHATE